MSSYDAVIPVSWSRLTEVLLPAWIDVITGRRTVDSFRDEHVRPDAPPYMVPLPFVPEFPAAYLSDIGWTSGAPFVDADALRRSPLHAVVERNVTAERMTDLLIAAITGSFSVELAGPDRFCDTHHHRYYGRLHSPPRHQVAGSKNGYWFLRTLFSVTYDAAGHKYRYEPTPAIDGELLALLDALFLSTRALPGTSVLDAGRAWPGFDDPRVLGLLAPREVQRLARHLDAIEARYREPEDDLFPLFLDRTRRAADQGFALVTVQEGL